MVRRGQPCVENDSGGRLDAEERAHGRGEHGSAGEGSAVDLEGGSWRRRLGGLVEGKRGRTVGGVGSLGEKDEKYPRSPRARKGLCKRLPLSDRVHKQNNFV